MNNILLDTNIYIYHSYGYPDVVDVLSTYMKKANILISSIQITELLSHSKVETDPDFRRRREKYIGLADTTIGVDSNIAEKAVEFMRKWYLYNGKKSKPADAIIAATALVNDASLISNNDRDFRYLQEKYGLRYENPVRDQQELQTFLERFKK